MILSVLDKIGIEVDDEYKWKDTLFLNTDTCSDDVDSFKKCKKIIKVKYSKTIDTSEARQIEDKIFACDKYIFDSEKKTKIYFEDDDTCILESNQEVNEWLTIMLEIMLLKEGYSFIHAAAAVDSKNKCLLLPSWGGVGKTATVSKLLNNGYKLLGDDLNILSDNGKIYGFPKKFVLYFYHKDLFPEVFEKKSIKCNSGLNKVYSSIIPATKRVLRKVPGLLAYARKHNPQSMKVSPYEIFGKEKIGTNGKISNVIWIERAVDKDYERSIKTDVVISKAISVTMNEVFGDSINAVLIMCGMNIISYDDVFRKIYDIYSKSFGNALTKEICVDKNKPVECVADKVIETIKV